MSEMSDHEETEVRATSPEEIQSGDSAHLRMVAETMDDYLDAAIAHRQVEDLQEEGIFVSIPAMRGVWGNGATLEDALIALRAGVEGWVALAQQRGEQLPTFAGLAPPKSRAA